MKNLKFILFAFAFMAILFSSCQKDKNNFDNNIEQTISNTSATNRNSIRTCSKDEHMKSLLADPNYKRAYDQRMKSFEDYNSKAVYRATCANPVVLPVAVHFQGVTNPDIACLTQLAQSQIDILNNDYQGTNSDISNWTNNASASFPGINNGEACLKFCIATKNHPAGYGLTEGSPAVTINKTTGDTDNKWAGYLNIFIQANTGVLGYSPLGGSGNGDGVVIDANAFGAGSGCGAIAPQSPYNLGRTLTHELGHYLLLDHIWGGGCAVDDEVADTPNSASSYSGCPNIGASSCNSVDLHMNYMDYTNDECMYMFSSGQATRMENYVNSSLTALVNNAANVCGDTTNPPTPTCNDGIKNGDETGVDCGGSCTPCQVEATCTDGIQNGDETGVDCGGSCTPCQVEATCTDGIQNGDETGVDCGGSCVPCQVEATCTDGIQNGDETGVDCGGSCVPCQVDTTCNDGEQKLIIEIKPDDYGSEIHWQLLDEDYEVVAEGGDFEDGDNTIKLTTTCVPEGCYTFVMFDDYGDGICCDYGQGWYQIKDASGSVILSSDGVYGYFEESDFCIFDSELRVSKRRTDPKRLDLARKTKSNH